MASSPSSSGIKGANTPVKEKKGQGNKRKIIDVAERILTRHDLRQITAIPSKRRSVDCVEQKVYECVV